MMHLGERDVAPVAVLCFFNELLERLAAEGVPRDEVYVLHSEIGHNPVYEFVTDEGPVTVVHPGVGAPLAAGFVEEMASLGVTHLRRVRRRGRAGRRPRPGPRHGRRLGAARRGHEPPLRRAESDHRRRSPRRSRARRGPATSMDIEHFVGRTWTTDAFFRETREPRRSPHRRALLGRGHGVLRVHRRRADTGDCDSPSCSTPATPSRVRSGTVVRGRAHEAYAKSSSRERHRRASPSRRRGDVTVATASYPAAISVIELDPLFATHTRPPMYVMAFGPLKPYAGPRAPPRAPRSRHSTRSPSCRSRPTCRGS